MYLRTKSNIVFLDSQQRRQKRGATGQEPRREKGELSFAFNQTPNCLQDVDDRKPRR
jgi:hypothetical protein